MKKRRIFVLLFAVALGLSGCSTAKVEKEPVVVKESEGEETSDITATPGITRIPARIALPTVLPYESETTFQGIIELEGTKETITCKNFQSELGYQMAYDIDRFTVTSEDGIDCYSVENPDPDIYPYIYVNVSRIDFSKDYAIENSGNSEYSMVEDTAGNIKGYLLKDSIELPSTGNSIPLGTILIGDSEPVTAENVSLGSYNAFHYTFTNGTDWDSTITEHYNITSGNYLYLIDVQYYVEAAEGYGARIKAMLDTFQILE